MVPWTYGERNPKFREKLNGRPSVLLLNKMDLVEPGKRQEVLKKFESQGIRTVFTDCKAQHHYSAKRIVPAVLDAVKDAEYEGSYIRKDPDKPYHLLVCGLPNTGKSSLINALRRTHLRKGKGTRVGKLPGMTTAIQEKNMINDEPKMYIFDTPGIMAPHIPTAEIGMKLASIGCFKDHMIGEDLIADFILYTLNKRKKLEYVQKLGLENPSDSIDFVLRHMATAQQYLIKGDRPDYLRASIQLISSYRKGEYGCFMLDG
ncbi:predicted protein [Nematostella vectensis]|uniref:Mitochondrial GTPase 1 n=1 Tax=Nematostella vectensis TaxID=45351 RepID=A7RX59_NEMVE|nr:predicted protein [Nematostella vectensis]|eukprot:XP_001636036.1 predicted protein [Nematostella vectensis]